MRVSSDFFRFSRPASNKQSMFISDYSEFLEPEMDLSAFGVMPTLSAPVEGGFLRPPTLIPSLEEVYQQFAEVISKRLTHQPYPSSFLTHSPLCPLCLKMVSEGASFATCKLNSDQQYLIHHQCLGKSPEYEMRTVETQQNTFSFAANNSKQSEYPINIKENRSFLVEIALTHPIGDKPLLKVSNRATLTNGRIEVVFREQNTDSFFPNVVALPCTDYSLTVSVSEVGKRHNQHKFTKYLPLKLYKKGGRSVASSDEVTVDFEIVSELKAMREVVDKMNFKYRFKLDGPLPLARVHGLSVPLPDDFEEMEEETVMVGSGNIDDLLEEKDTAMGKDYTLNTSTPLTSKQLRYSLDSGGSSGEEEKSSPVNLQKLVQSNTLIQYVKNNTQSRVFQQFLGECAPADIESVIEQITPKLSELIKHEYGNYMVQKLFTVCSPYQRLQLLQVVYPDLPELVCNKQGTHTLQAFIGLFTLPQQFSYAVGAVNEKFYELCRNNNATHFIQKIVKTFPVPYTINFFSYLTDNLMAFALDKNAMCVIKHMMRRLRQLEGPQEGYGEAVEAIKQQILLNVTFNVEALIMDSFGNYVIQFCYELFDLSRCAGITQSILVHFTHYASGKFSSNVLLKCISVYWTDWRIYDALLGLSHVQIVEVFRNKDGNKILLEMMERLEGSAIQGKISGVLLKVEPTRFYHDRWGVCLGSRSGQVGGSLRLGPHESAGKQRSHHQKYTRKH